MEDKKIWTETVLTEIAKKAGYDRCEYEKTEDNEFVNVFSKDNWLCHKVCVHCDSEIAMVADLMKYIY